MTTPATTSQTVGPYFKIGLSSLYTHELVRAGTPGERVTIQGQLLDGEGKPVPDAVLEIWQADAQGQYVAKEDAEREDADAHFSGFGRIPTDEAGFFRFSSIKPGNVMGPDGKVQAPHIEVSIFMRGLLTRLVTRIYFSGDSQNESDFVLGLVDEDRRSTLFAVPASGKVDVWTWDVNLQGKNETVFFDF